MSNIAPLRERAAASLPVAAAALLGWWVLPGESAAGRLLGAAAAALLIGVGYLLPLVFASAIVAGVAGRDKTGDSATVLPSPLQRAAVGLLIVAAIGAIEVARRSTTDTLAECVQNRQAASAETPAEMVRACAAERLR
jgi:hypothetical protein